MSVPEHEFAESGLLPGRYQWVEEPTPMGVPENPEWNRFSDNMRQWEATGGANLERIEGLGTADATGHGRGTEEPEATIAYDMQRFPVDGTGAPVGAEAYAAERDEYNRLFATLMCVGRTEDRGGNFDAGIRQYTVMRGVAFDTVEATLDPTENDPILIELEAVPRKVRSYIIHQPDGPISVVAESSEPAEDDGLEITVEDEDAETVETVELGTATTDTFEDIDSVWLSDEPVGDITIEADGDGTIVMEGTSTETEDVVAGGLTYSDDDQPVDGDRGVPSLGDGANADPINETFEFFVGDRLERAPGTPYRPRINSASWTIENSLEDESLHQTRAPTNDAGSRNIQLEADIAGRRASHDSMMDSLQKTSFPVYHELSGGVVEFPAVVILESDGRSYEADDQAVAALSETLEATDGEGIEFHSGETIEDVTA
ncbi:hypothetical protein [Natronorarus salvus]|uniref:hypothetical protein n=1 Tax=Natronorarus salvus TaxID=3117733 RepID=UPI002F265DA1